MKRLKSWSLVCALFVPFLPVFSAEEIPGKVIFSVEQVDFDTGPRGKTGIFFYYREVGLGKASLTGYRFQDGKVTDLSGGNGEQMEEQVRKLKTLPISSFDVAKELDAARQKMRTQTRRDFSVLDGATYRIRYDFNEVSIDYSGQTPGVYIDFLAPYSENLTNLKELMEFLALSYGRRVFSF